MLGILFQKEHIRTLLYEGTLTATKRLQVLDTFKNNGNCRVLLIGLKCGAEGLNITVANHVIFAEPWWNPMAEKQAEARVHRLKQTKKCFVYRPFMKGTIEEHVMSIGARKQTVALAVRSTEQGSSEYREAIKALQEVTVEDSAFYLSLLKGNTADVTQPSAQKTRQAFEQELDPFPQRRHAVVDAASIAADESSGMTFHEQS
jgi:superfamily II DNA or RNA helicase